MHNEIERHVKANDHTVLLNYINKAQDKIVALNKVIYFAANGGQRELLEIIFKHLEKASFEKRYIGIGEKYSKAADIIWFSTT